MKKFYKVNLYTDTPEKIDYSKCKIIDDLIITNVKDSTKTWKNEFDKQFKNYCFYSSLDFKSEVKQFISDLRKKDEQQLLLKLSLETQYYGREIEMKISKIIEEYYVKN